MLIFSMFGLVTVMVVVLFISGSSAKLNNIKLIEQITFELSHVRNLSYSMYQQNHMIKLYVLTGDIQYLRDIDNSRKEMKTSIENLAKAITSREMQQQLGTIRLTLNQYNRTIDFIILVRKEKGKSSAEQYMSYGGLLKNAENEMKILSSMSIANAQSEISHDSEVLNKIQLLFIIIFLIATTAAFFISRKINSLIVKPFEELLTGAKKISRGEFDYRVKLSAGNEFSEVGDAFNTMAAELKESFFELHGAKVKLEENITELKQSNDDRKKLESQLIQTQKMEAIGTLAGGIAHDFNNILSAIIGFSELSLFDHSISDKTKRNLNEILKASDRAKELVSRILLFSRQSEQEKVTVSPAVIIAEAMKLLRASIPTSIDIKQTISSSSLIMAVPTQIHQVVMNLCTNASFAMKENAGVLEVTLEDIDIDKTKQLQNHNLTPGKYVKLTVSDTGTGIPEEIIYKIFNPFFTTKPIGKGTGMGLSMVHGIVKNSGGDIWVYSEVGKGTIFHLYFPITEVEYIKLESAQNKLKRGSETILMVDDEPAIVEIGKSILESLGYRVKGFTESKKAAEELINGKEKYDAVITDKTMPHMTGIELAKKIRTNGIDIPVLMITGYGDKASMDQLRETGIEEIIMKPFLADTLSNTLRKILDKKTNLG